MASVREAAAAGSPRAKADTTLMVPPSAWTRVQGSRWQPGPEQKRRWLCSQPNANRGLLPEEAADTISFHNFNILKSSWRGYREQDCICLPCSFVSGDVCLRPLLAFCRGRGGGVFLNSNSSLPIIDFSILGYFGFFS